MVSKAAKREAGKKSKKNMWKEFLLPFCPSWALILETLDPKKTANGSIFRKILEEFDDVVAKEGKEENYQFNVAQLRSKYKSLKRNGEDKHTDQNKPGEITQFSRALVQIFCPVVYYLVHGASQH